jgi:hypothetical protein
VVRRLQRIGVHTDNAAVWLDFDAAESEQRRIDEKCR